MMFLDLVLLGLKWAKDPQALKVTMTEENSKL